LEEEQSCQGRAPSYLRTSFGSAFAVNTITTRIFIDDPVVITKLKRLRCNDGGAGGTTAPGYSLIAQYLEEKPYADVLN